MSRRCSRRGLLTATAAGVGAVAGCSALPSLGGSPPPVARWSTDVTESAAEFTAPEATAGRPASIVADAEFPAEHALGDPATLTPRSAWEALSPATAEAYVHLSGRAFVLEGAQTGAGAELADRWTRTDPYRGYDVFVPDEDDVPRAAAVDGGTFVLTTRARTTSPRTLLKRVLDAGEAATDRAVGASEVFGTLVDRVGDADFLTGGTAPASGTSFLGTAVSLRVGASTTTVEGVDVYPDASSVDVANTRKHFGTYGVLSGDLDDATVSTDGKTAVFEATFDSQYVPDWIRNFS